MNSLERRLFVLEDSGGSRADRLADAIVLRLLGRGDEADPNMAAEAERLIASPSWSDELPFGLSFPAFCRPLAQATGRFLPPESLRALANMLAGDGNSSSEVSH